MSLEDRTATRSHRDYRTLKSNDVATEIEALARRHGITAAPEPMDTFVSAVTHLCSDVEVTLDHTERLLVGLARAGAISDEQRFELHADYLRQKSSAVRFTQ